MSSPANPTFLSEPVANHDLDALTLQLRSDSLKKQLPAIEQLSVLPGGSAVLQQFLVDQVGKEEPAIAAGKAYQVLHALRDEAIAAFLQTTFPTGLAPLPSEANIDYQPLQTLLVDRQYEEADRLTLQKLCELAGPGAEQRNWLYFTEVENFPSLDLQTIDRLWRIYSEGKFGFSKQREVWLSVGQNWESLWTKIAWKRGNVWTRYPAEFIWDVSAPPGHLPLSNQLRGVRAMAALLSHPAWG